MKEGANKHIVTIVKDRLQQAPSMEVSFLFFSLSDGNAHRYFNEEQSHMISDIFLQIPPNIKVQII